MSSLGSLTSVPREQVMSQAALVEAWTRYGVGMAARHVELGPE
jgi:hypothetical protein